MIHRCLGCRGLANAGLLPKWQAWVWKAATIHDRAAYHLVHLRYQRRVVVGGGAVWDAETACGEAIAEEVYAEGDR